MYRKALNLILGAALIWPNTVWGYYHFPNLDKSIRLRHAKELLGSRYDKSIVRFGEKFRHIERFIFSQVKSSLKDPWKPQARRLAKAIMDESIKYEFDPIFIMAVIKHESVFNPSTKGSFGEIGLMQIKPSTAEWISERYDIPYHGSKTLFDPVVNVRLGTAYMDYLRDRFSAHGRLYVSAYNMGAGNVHKALDKSLWPKDYTSKVMHQYIVFYTELVKSRTPDEKVINPMVLANSDSEEKTPTAF